MLSMAAFALQWQGWVVVTEKVWSQKSKLITKDPVQEKLIHLLGWISDLQALNLRFKVHFLSEPSPAHQILHFNQPLQNALHSSI